MSNSLQPHELQHTRLPCPSLFPWVCSNSDPLSQWCQPTISSSVALFFSGPQFSPASESFQMSRLFASGGQSVGASASASVFPVNIYGWFPVGLTGLISLLSKGPSSVLSSTTVQKHQFFSWTIFTVQLSQLYMTTGKAIALLAKWCLCFLFVVWVCHSFSSKEQASFNFMAAVTICSNFWAQENEICHCFHFFFIYLPWSDGTRCHDL